MKPIEWTDAHRREAAWLLCRIAESAALRGEMGAAERSVDYLSVATASEYRLRARLAGVLDARCIDHEVRRVDRLARGVLVRIVEVRGDIYCKDLPGQGNRNRDYEQAKAFAALPGIAALRPYIVKRTITRIRRAR
jgi:hypothetical protein